MRPKRELFRKAVEDAVSRCPKLSGCRVEVVGSTSWGGEVPQSDLDLVIVTPSENQDATQALVLLQALHAELEEEPEEKRAWGRVELIEARKVPVVQLYDSCPNGLSCDVSVDQMHSLQHRKILNDALRSQPETRDMIKLVKYWLRQRGLPNSAQGGLPSFAWAYLALNLAGDLPTGRTVERLLHYFFSRMSMLGEMSLSMRFTEQGVRFVWKPRAGPAVWTKEWIELLWVDDPCQKQSSSASWNGSGFAGMTTQYITSALGALYVAEVRMALKTVREDKWEDLWRLTTPEVSKGLPSVIDLKSQQDTLHIVLKDGVLLVGELQEVRTGPHVNYEGLHRRDQISELMMRPCKRRVSKDNSDAVEFTVSTGAMMCCKPIHWVCALPIWNMKVMPGDGLSRLQELTILVGAHTGFGMMPIDARECFAMPAGMLGKGQACMSMMPVGVYPVWTPMIVNCQSSTPTWQAAAGRQATRQSANEKRSETPEADKHQGEMARARPVGQQKPTQKEVRDAACDGSSDWSSGLDEAAEAKSLASTSSSSSSSSAGPAKSLPSKGRTQAADSSVPRQDAIDVSAVAAYSDAAWARQLAQMDEEEEELQLRSKRRSCREANQAKSLGKVASSVASALAMAIEEDDTCDEREPLSSESLDQITEKSLDAEPAEQRPPSETSQESRPAAVANSDGSTEASDSEDVTGLASQRAQQPMTLYLPLKKFSGRSGEIFRSFAMSSALNLDVPARCKLGALFEPSNRNLMMGKRMLPSKLAKSKEVASAE
eukprot:TRINITY_DN29289_c0_g1_i1.p1 TRINITY_DN29289_c0_g1~~TRINITY_DN29289_c0_g1_i1.p1  ORF type:complete len:907 (+),score=167.09 TRINITY_DN29289_c0_g1_i1:408-2723(+)